MKFFFDNCVSQKLANAMKAFGVDVIHLREKFGEDALDEEWIPAMAGQGRVVITTDHAIYNRDDQRKLVKHAGLTFFLLAKNFESQDKWQQAERLFGYWPSIEKQCARIKPGQFWLVQLNGKMELGTRP